MLVVFANLQSRTTSVWRAFRSVGLVLLLARSLTCVCSRSQHFLKQYHKAIDTYEAGLKLDPNNEELKDGLR